MANIPTTKHVSFDPSWYTTQPTKDRSSPTWNPLLLRRLPTGPYSVNTYDTVYTHSLAHLDFAGRITIRLLRFVPGEDWQLKEFALPEAPKYSALSYSWGAGSQVEAGLNLRQAGSQLLITKGLETALLQISHDASDWVWVDAICINQDDAAEKNFQVSRMKLIYERAQDVLVWLGEAVWHSRSSSAQSLAAGAGQSDHQPRGQLPATPCDLPDDIATIWYGFDPRQFENLLHYGYISWWNRLWVLQEIVSSARVFVCIGPYVVPWDDFTHALRSLPAALEKLSWKLDKRTSGLLQSATKHVKQVYDLRKHLRSSPGGEEILDLIRLTSASHASDPRDKIYGLLGLARERDRKGVQISYADSVAKVFADFTKHVIRTKASLDVLVDQWGRNVGQSPPYKEDVLPSWIPDFSRPPRRKPLSINRVKTYYASASTIPGDESADEDCLSISAKLVDVVDAVMSDCVQESEEGEELDTFRLFTLPVIRTFVSHDRLARTMSNDSRKSLIRSDSLWQTLVVDHGHSSISPAPPTFETVFNILEQSVSDDGIDEYDTLLEKLGEHAALASEYVRQITTTLRRRMLITTTAGFVGVAAVHVKKGDIVVIAHGASTPWVLRETAVAGNYSLVVDCYLEGIMYGEAMRCGIESEVMTLV